LDAAAKTGDVADRIGQVLQDTEASFNALRQPPQPKPATPPATGYAPEQSREMNRAIQQSVDGGR
jgi:hypothetical protein